MTQNEELLKLIEEHESPSDAIKVALQIIIDVLNNNTEKH
jgi:hypothetical protein